MPRNSNDQGNFKASRRGVNAQRPAESPFPNRLVSDGQGHHTDGAGQTNRLAYSIREVCELTSLGRTSILALISSGQLVTKKVLGRVLVLAWSVEALLQEDEA